MRKTLIACFIVLVACPLWAADARFQLHSHGDDLYRINTETGETWELGRTELSPENTQSWSTTEIARKRWAQRFVDNENNKKVMYSLPYWHLLPEKMPMNVVIEEDE